MAQCSTTATQLVICTLRGESSTRHQPRLTELGSVWLPLPHVLLIPFVQIYSWWASGFAGVIPSALAWLASCAGIYRLARHWLPPASSALALAFFALNPNLLYLQTTAMTEPLFICEMVWVVVWLVEWRASLDADLRQARRLLWCIAVALVAAVFTRYDGWCLALVAWTCMGLTLAHRGPIALSQLLDCQRPHRGRAGGMVRL